MYYFIVNPNSRSGRGRSIWNEIHQQLMLRGIDFQYCLTRYSGHAAEIASDACALGTESEPVYIIAVGGDGTCLLYTSYSDFVAYYNTPFFKLQETIFISIIFYIPLTELYCSQSDQHALINIPISSEFVKKISLHITVISCRIYNKSTDSQRQPEYCHSAGIFPGLQIP